MNKWVLCFALAGCVQHDPGVNDAGSICETGATESCACTDGETGAQTCLSPSEGWGTCSCVPHDAGPSYPPLSLYGTYEGFTNFIAEQNWEMAITVESDHSFSGSYYEIGGGSDVVSVSGSDDQGDLTGTEHETNHVDQWGQFQFVVDGSNSTASRTVYIVNERECYQQGIPDSMCGHLTFYSVIGEVSGSGTF